MATWTCDECGRTFGAVGRSHVCEPGVSLDEFVDGSIPGAADITSRVVSHLRSRGDDVIVDPLASVVLFKRGATFAMLRRRTRWLAVEFRLRRRLTSPRLSRKVQEHHGWYWHVVNVSETGAIDAELLDWLSESYAGEDVARPSGDPMIPDDVDVELV